MKIQEKYPIKIVQKMNLTNFKHNRFSKSDKLIFIENIPENTEKIDFQEYLEHKEIIFHVFRFSTEDKTKGSIEIFELSNMKQTINQINQCNINDQLLIAREISNQERIHFMTKKKEKFQEIITLKGVKYIYSLDFELACVGKACIPLEIGCVKLGIQKNEILGSFHEFINPGEIVDFSIIQTCDYTQKFIHGIPYKNMKQLTKKSVKEIWENFERFLLKGTNLSEIIVYAKASHAEKQTLSWIESKIKKKIEFNIVDLKDLLNAFESKDEESITNDMKFISGFLNEKNKCKFHQNQSFQFHCSLNDSFANSLFIQKGIQEHSFKNLLVHEFHPISIPEETEEDLKNFNPLEWNKGVPDDYFFN
jgi:hypothetical protein